MWALAGCGLLVGGQGTPPLAASEFVKSVGTHLTLGPQPYRFEGLNIYMAASRGQCGGTVRLNRVLDQIGSRQNVFRVWFFQSFAVSHGRFDWHTFNHVLITAKSHHERVIVTLANESDYCDGPLKTLAWWQQGYRSTVFPGDLVTYRQWVADVVSRYKSNPTIAMWQLVNEGEAVNNDGSCDEPVALSAMLIFSSDVGGMVHSLDPNHVVSLGTPAGYSGYGLQWCGAENGDYQVLMASPGNDVCDFHDYGYPTEPMGDPQAPDLATAIQMCHADDKPIMVAETGILVTSPQKLKMRARELRAKFDAQFRAGVVGELMWSWVNASTFVLPATPEDYGIGPGDPSLRILGHY
jgi:mannan endo-1,4-beta-mannosidase